MRMCCNIDLLDRNGEDGESDDRMIIELSYAALIREIHQAPGVVEIAEKRWRLPALGLKHAATPLVDIVWIYALRHGIRETRARFDFIGMAEAQMQ